MKIVNSFKKKQIVLYTSTEIDNVEDDENFTTLKFFNKFSKS